MQAMQEFSYAAPFNDGQTEPERSSGRYCSKPKNQTPYNVQGLQAISFTYI
jgi:hypothetical protein